MNNDLLKLKVSLADAIQEWIETKCLENEWSALETNIADETSELMADAAFNILLAQKILTEYLTREEIINHERR